MSDWPIHKVGDLEKENLLLVQDGNHGEYRPRKNEFIEKGIAFIRAADLGQGVVQFQTAEKINDVAFERIRKGIGKDLDTVLSTKGTVGKIAFVPEGSPHYVCSPQTSFWRSLDHEFIDPKYLYYEIQSRHFFNQIASRKGETDMADYLSLTSQRGLTIRVPPIEEQREIASVLGSVDGKIELNRQINKTLEQIAQAIFKSWFVDFEPVKAKIQAKQNGQDPERAAMRAISGNTDEELDSLNEDQRQQLTAYAALFPNELEDSELGEIPKGWGLKPFGELLSKTIGGDWGKEEPDKKHTEKVRILRGTDLPNVYIGTDDSVPIRYVESKKLDSRKLEDGDIVIEVSGGSPKQPTGRSLYITQAILDRLNGVVEPASFCRLFRPINKEVGLILSVHLAKIYQDGKTWLYQNQSTGISNFQTKIFLDKEIVLLPNEETINHFFELVRPIYDKMYASENKSLTQTRDTLLPKLLSGELEVVGI